MPAPRKSHVELGSGTTTNGSAAELSGRPSDWFQDVLGWNDGSVFSLHWVVRWPSQSTSKSAV
jgi:hypothetical protein